MKHLMIHEWKDKYFDIKLDDYILSFDDGLYSQVEPIFKICELYPNIKILYYVSTGLINLDETRSFDSCVVAHQKFFDYKDTSNYVSYNDLIKLSKLKNVTIGLHGHNHLRLEHLKKNLSLSDYFKVMVDDIEKMYNIYNLFYSMKIITSDEINYCTPYNYNDGLYNALMRKKFDICKNIIIVGYGREDINTLI